MTGDESDTTHTLPTLAQQAVRRSLIRKQDLAEDEVRRMIDAGRELLSHGGNTRVADIVAAASLSNDAFYRYFRSKEDFVGAVVEDGDKRLVSYVQHKMTTQEDDEDKLRAAIDAILSQAADPEVATATRNVLANPTGPHREAGVRNRLEASLADLLTDTLSAMTAADPGRDARAIVRMLVGTMENFLWAVSEPSNEDLSHIEDFIIGALSRHHDG